MKKILLLLMLIGVSLTTSCTDSSSGFDADEVCPATGKNYRYGGPNRGKFVDERDGQVYKYITIGDKIWMDQNLNYASENSICYNELQVNCDVYGRLYLLQNDTLNKENNILNLDMLDTICPKDWRVPTLDEWNAIVDQMDGLEHFKNSECMDVSLYAGYAYTENDLTTGEILKYKFHNVSRTREWATTTDNGRAMYSFAIDYTGDIQNNASTVGARGMVPIRCIKKEDWEL